MQLAMFMEGEGNAVPHHTPGLNTAINLVLCLPLDEVREGHVWAGKA